MLSVDIWSDVVCPWCYLGKRRFETALGRFEHRDQVTVAWHSFELDPQAGPASGVSGAERLAAKYGMTVPDARARHAELERLAAAEGLEYHLDQTRGGNSFDAHRLHQLAIERGAGDAAMERLMRAYFTEGEAIDDHPTLVRLAHDVGVPPADAAALLGSDDYAPAVREDERIAQRLGIQGVPFFVLARRFGVSGAQPAELMLQALWHAWTEERKAG